MPPTCTTWQSTRRSTRATRPSTSSGWTPRAGLRRRRAGAAVVASADCCRCQPMPRQKRPNQSVIKTPLSPPAAPSHPLVVVSPPPSLSLSLSLNCRVIQRQSGVDYSDMLFFDNERWRALSRPPVHAHLFRRRRLAAHPPPLPLTVSTAQPGFSTPPPPLPGPPSPQELHGRRGPGRHLRVHAAGHDAEALAGGIGAARGRTVRRCNAPRCWGSADMTARRGRQGTDHPTTGGTHGRSSPPPPSVPAVACRTH